MVFSKIQSDFFLRDTIEVSQALLGKILVFQKPSGIMKGIITETEAYTQTDPACHAFGGKKTKRNDTMFKRGGHFYVYLIYGIHHCINIVTETDGQGCAVLIRALHPLPSDTTFKPETTNGPGKLTQTFGFNKTHDGLDLTHPQSPIFVEDHNITLKTIRNTTRIGISKGTELKWRWIAKF